MTILLLGEVGLQMLRSFIQNRKAMTAWVKSFFATCIVITFLSCGTATKNEKEAKTASTSASMLTSATASGTSAEALTFASNKKADNADFGGYWYQGKAEISSYQLSQARYGEMRQGEAVLIFVTEDFSKEKQVKLDYPGRNPADAVNVLKMNFTKRFDTGIYPYSMMLSTFTPVESVPSKSPATIKISTSSQEWCGHTFSQLNLSEKGYRSEIRSYFESEGDVNSELGNHLSEDELWTAIRLNPLELPTGNTKLIPSTFAARLLHFDLDAQEAELKLEKHPENRAHMLYSIYYPEMDRTLKITFQQAFPHTIVAWEETYKDGFGPNAAKLTTRARILEQRLLPYWSMNSNSDSHLREELGLIK